jgi:hypothetical protein
MRRNRILALYGVAALVVLIVVIVSPWNDGGDGEGSASDVASTLRETLEERHTPPVLTNCVVSQVERHLSDAEVKQAQAAAPAGGGDASSVAELAPFRAELSRYGLICLEKLIHSHKFSHQQVSDLLNAKR